MSLKTRLSVLLISTPVLAFVLVGGLLGTSSAAGNDVRFQYLRVFQDVIGLVLDSYVTEVDPADAMEGAIRGLAESLDPDSAYLTADQVQAIEAGTGLPSGDVGLELTRQYYLRVIAARDGSPAAKAGLRTLDYVRAIDGRPTRDMSVFEGSRLLRGEPGSKVTLTIIRGNAAEPHDVTLVREAFTGSLVTSRPLDNGLGYLRVVAFRDGVAKELRQHADALAGRGAGRLIVDVRGTAEGEYDQGLAAARLFVKSGTLARKAGRDEHAQESIDARPGDGAIALPVTVLTTTGTSGPAELFVSALAHHNRADIVGERTLGRAGVQKLVKLPERRGLWLTYARYLRPDGEPLHGRGLQPDVAVNEPAVEFGSKPPEKDAILEAAVAHATGAR